LTAQVWYSPALTAFQLLPATSTQLGSVEIGTPPNCPEVFSPKQANVPFVRKAQVWDWPQETRFHPVPPALKGVVRIP